MRAPTKVRETHLGLRLSTIASLSLTMRGSRGSALTSDVAREDRRHVARPGTWRRAVALVTALAIAAPAGAIAQAMGHGECRSCPPTCPMHRPGKPRCHDPRRRTRRRPTDRPAASSPNAAAGSTMASARSSCLPRSCRRPSSSWNAHRHPRARRRRLASAAATRIRRRRRHRSRAADGRSSDSLSPSLRHAMPVVRSCACTRARCPRAREASANERSLLT